MRCDDMYDKYSCAGLARLSLRQTCDKCEILINKYENLKDHLDESIMKKIGKFLNKYEEMKETITKDIKLVLYNNRKENLNI